MTVPNSPVYRQRPLRASWSPVSTHNPTRYGSSHCRSGDGGMVVAVVIVVGVNVVLVEEEAVVMVVGGGRVVANVGAVILLMGARP